MYTFLAILQVHSSSDVSFCEILWMHLGAADHILHETFDLVLRYWLIIVSKHSLVNRDYDYNIKLMKHYEELQKVTWI